jgi:hypothetical protein
MNNNLDLQALFTFCEMLFRVEPYKNLCAVQRLGMLNEYLDGHFISEQYKIACSHYLGLLEGAEETKKIFEKNLAICLTQLDTISLN